MTLALAILSLITTGVSAFIWYLKTKPTQEQVKEKALDKAVTEEREYVEDWVNK